MDRSLIEKKKRKKKINTTPLFTSRTPPPAEAKFAPLVRSAPGCRYGGSTERFANWAAKEENAYITTSLTYKFKLTRKEIKLTKILPM